jgi:hypothetical protein
LVKDGWVGRGFVTFEGQYAAVVWLKTVFQFPAMCSSVHHAWKLNGRSGFQATQRFSSTNRTLATPNSVREIINTFLTCAIGNAWLKTSHVAQ